MKNAAVTRQRRLKLQTSYGQAMMLSKGFGAEETKAAFTRAQELAAGIENATERFDTYYGLWVSNLLRGEVGLARETAETFLREANSAGRMTEAGVASRNLGMTCLFQGDLMDARAHLEEALRIYNPERDREAKYRFGTDPGAAAGFLAHTSWVMGEVGRARELIDETVECAVESDHVPTLTYAYFMKAMFEILRGDADAALRVSDRLVELSREHQMGLYLGWGLQSSGWAHAKLGDRETGVTELRNALAAHLAQGNKQFVPFYQGLLAELEAEGRGVGEALIRVEDALALAQQTGDRWTDAFLHRIRGEILLKRDPANTAPAEEGFLTAISIAQQQKAKSFELRAALSLAKLYQSTRRAADAHVVLAPALEGFSPTPEFPEIAEAQNLIASLAEADEVKSAAASRRRRLKLQTAYGNALIATRGYQAADTTAAFVRARELAAGVEDLSERFSVYYGQWAGSFVRADLMPMREIAQIMLRDCRNRPNSPEAGIAHRLSGETHWFAGNFREARADLERALAIFDSERDRELAFRFGQDVVVTANSFLACVLWPLGEVDRAHRLAEEMVMRAVRGGHIATIAWVRVVHALFEVMFGNPVRATTNVTEAVAVAREHGMKLWMAFGGFLEPWAHSHTDDRDASIKGMLYGIAMLEEQGVWLYGPLLRTALAKAETEARQFESALATIDRAIVETERTGQRWYEAETHRIRGKILLKRNPANTAPAEEAFLTAFAIAQQQKARSFELRAALSLAKLYQSTGRAADAHAVLAPAVEGFSPTPEFSEIEEAKRLLAALE